MSLLPSPLKTGDVFKSSAVRAINALIEYCRTHEIRGDNRTVQVNQTPSGVMLSVILRPGSGQGAGAGIYNGPFAVTYDSEAKKLKIKKGFRNVNGEFAEVPDGEAEAAEGTLCLHMEKDAETGEPCEPSFRIAVPSAQDFPIARIERDGEAWRITQYYVAVAFFLFARKCVYAVSKGSLDE